MLLHFTTCVIADFILIILWCVNAAKQIAMVIGFPRVNLYLVKWGFFFKFKHVLNLFLIFCHLILQDAVLKNVVPLISKMA